MFGIFKGSKRSAPETTKKVKRVYVRSQRNAFDAAQVSSLFSEWTTFSKPINAQLESELRSLRARSRQLRKNDPYIRRFHKLCKSNIVGPNGFVLRSQAAKSNGKPWGIARDAVEKAWKKASRKGVICAQGRYTRVDLENMIVDQVFGDGEVIIIQNIGKSEGEFGTSFQFIDTELLDVNINSKLAPYKVKMGVETNNRGAVIAYHFHSTDSMHSDFYSYGGRGYIRIPKQRVIHEFFTEYVGQLRGYPEAVAAMTRLRMLDGYEEAELVAARVGSASMGFIERGENGGGFDSGDEIIDDDDDTTVEEVEEKEIEIEPGIHYIDNGAKFHQFSSNHPTTAYKDYVKTVLRGIASGLGVDYNTLANDLEGVNFSSLRGGVLESRELWRCAQTWFVEHIFREIYERWLEAALLSNAIRLPRGDALRAADIDLLKEAEFQGRRWAWVDPLKDLQAAKLAVDEGFMSRSAVIRERGDDPEEVWQERQKEVELMKKYGVCVVSEPTKSTVTTNEEDEE